MKDMYSKPTNRTELSILMNSSKTKALRSHSKYIQTKERSGNGNNQNVPEQSDQESSITFEIYSDYACLKSYVVGADPKDTISDKVIKYLHYNINDHNHDVKHSEVIAQIVATQLGDVDGCLTVLDFHIPLTALVCARLGKPGIPFSSARLVNSKRLTLEALREQASADTLHSYASRCWSVERLEDVEEAARQVGFPAVLKTESGAGALSVMVVQNTQDAKEHFQLLQSLLHNRSGLGDYKPMTLILGAGFGSSCMFMEYLHGSEHCVDLALFHGQLLCAFVTDKLPQDSATGKFYHGICIIPSKLPKAKEVEVIRAAVDCCTGLGLHHGVFDVDIMLTGSGPKLIEINARVGGYCQREFVLRCYGVDLLHLACFLACDVRPTLSSPPCVDDDVSTSRKDTATETPLTDAYNITQHKGLLDGRPMSEPGQRKVPLSLPALKSHGSLVGLKLYPHLHGQALKTTACPATLQKLHEDGKLLFLRHDAEVRETSNRPTLPFCSVAVHGHSYSAALCKLQEICLEIGIEMPEPNGISE